MWLIFAGDWARWLAAVGAVVLVVGLLAMPKAERARFFRAWTQQRRQPRRSSALLGSPPSSGEIHAAREALGDDADHQPGPVRMPERLESFSSAARLLVALFGFVALALLALMVLTLLTSLPGWS